MHVRTQMFLLRKVTLDTHTCKLDSSVIAAPRHIKLSIGLIFEDFEVESA